MSQRSAGPSIDSSLVDRCRSHDAEAFGLLVDRYQARVYGFVRRMVHDSEDSEDIAQEVFVRAFQNIHRFDGRASLSTWLFKIASNLCIDRARRRERTPENVPSDAPQLSDFEPADTRWDPLQAAVAKEMEAVVELCIAELSDKLRPVLMLHDMEGLTYDEIAGVLGIPVGTVKSRLFLARGRLQKALQDYMRPGEIS